MLRMRTPLKGYSTLELLHSSARTLVYRGRRIADQLPIIIKLLQSDYPSFSELVNFRNQYAIASVLDLPGVVKPIALENYGNGLALIMEDFGGVSLLDYAAGQPLNLEGFLPIAIALSQILEGLYRHRVIHKDIKPSNIIIHPRTRQVKLIDFSIASLLPNESQQIQNPNTLEGTLAYISPEQTGRMNRGIDYRSDFYSLGVTFYQLLTGTLPFLSVDPMELVHCHIARMPVSPHAVRPEIPLAISDIVMKLMAKTAERRYQSAYGIGQDLERCWQQLKTHKIIATFELATRDVSDRFIIPEKLYGREVEVQTLLEAFERVAEGNAEMMLVAGFSGIGKTAVVNEVHKPIVRQRGYFIKGKFDQFQRNIPFSAFVQAFRDLMGQLLGEADAQLQQWKAKILSALGEQSQVIIDVIPELESIVGPQPAVAELSGTAAQNRFNLLFGKFIQVFATKKHPLVIFIDDLQWVDSASVTLMKLLMSQTETRYLLSIGAYRDNEVNPVHPLMLALEEIGKTQAMVNTITLAPLNQSDINYLIAETLSCSPDLAIPLTELVYQKAKGNPFFTNQFIRSLREDGWIYFDFDGGNWQCDISRVRELSLTDDVVEFMANRLHKLPEKTQNILKFAACIGNKFDLETLAIVQEKSQSEAALDLWSAMQEGLILPRSKTYKLFAGAFNRDRQDNDDRAANATYIFLHDRVQQAAYFLIPEAEKNATHLKIGQLLLKNTPETERDENIFEIVSQLNWGVALLERQEDRNELARLNLIAARKAKAATAYSAAVKYLNVGLKLLAENSWENQYKFTLDLFVEAVETEFLNSNFERAYALAEIVLNRSRDILEKIKVYDIKFQAGIAENKFQETIKLGLQVVENLGVSLEEKPPDLRAIEELVNLPEITDSYKLAALQILSTVHSAAFITDRNLMMQITFTKLQLSIDYGNSPLAALTYLDYGLFLCGVVGDFDAGYRLGKVGIQLLDRFGANEIKSIGFHSFNGSIRHWKEHLRESLGSCLEAFQVGQDNGELVYSGYELVAYCNYLFLLGEPLDLLESKCGYYAEVLQQQNLIFHIDFARIHQQIALNLQGKSAARTELIGEAFDETASLPFLLENKIGISLFFIYVLKAIVCYNFAEPETAIASIREAEKWQSSVTGFLMIAISNFYYSLALLECYPQVETGEGQNYLNQVEFNQQQMRQWANGAPMNFQHKYDLVEAEKARVLGDKLVAIELYDRAIAGAKENGYVQEEAIANELATKFYLGWDKQKIAGPYVIEAYYAYARWGAKAKVEDLEKRYSSLLGPILNSEKTRLNSRDTISQMNSGTLASADSSSGVSALLDLSSAIKASQALSGEIQLAQLLSKLMQLTAENAGASKSALLLFDEETLAIEAIADYPCDDETTSENSGR